MKTAISTTISLDVRAGIDRLAQREDRSRSSIIDRLLREGLKAHEGSLPLQEAKQGAPT